MSIKREIPQIVEWLRTRVKEANCQGLVVGLSGGLDSAVCAALIKQAFPTNSLAVILPIYSHPQDAQDALAVAHKVEIDYFELDLSQDHTNLIQRSLEQLRSLGHEPEKRLMDANLRARLRMVTVYAVANALNYLVVGTDNAAEMYTGYFTKYGDGACDLLPLAEFTKGEVRDMAHLLDLPQVVINKAPSAGLWEGQTDENEMGTSYDVIDAHLRGEAIPERDRLIIETLHKRTHHKRTTPPKYNRN